MYLCLGLLFACAEVVYVWPITALYGSTFTLLTFSVRRSVREKEAVETLISFYFIFRLPQKVQIEKEMCMKNF